MPPVQTLTCSNCGATLATSAPPGASLRCDYCGAPLVVPATAAGEPGASGSAPSPGQPRPSALRPESEADPIVVPPERITVIPAGGRARDTASGPSRLSLYLALFVLACCGLPLATALLCIATGLVGGLDLR
jgi:hypothetical protein